MPDCPSIDPLLTPYVDGELPGVEREAVAQHLRACPPCRARVVVEQAVRDLVRARQPALQRDRASDALRTKCAMLGSVETARSSRARRVQREPLEPLDTSLEPLEPLVAIGDASRAARPGGDAAPVVAGVSLYQITERSTHVMAAELAADHVKCFLLQNLSGTEQPAGPVEYALASKFGWPVASAGAARPGGARAGR